MLFFIVVTFIFCGLLTGFLISKIVFRNTHFSLVEIAPISFSLSLAFISLLGYVLDFFKLEFGSFILIYLVLNLLLLLLAAILHFIKPSRLIDFSLETVDYVLLLFAFVCVVFTFWGGVWLSHTADSFYHIAAVRSIIQNNEILVKNMFVQSNYINVDPTAGTWHLMLAIISKLSSVSPEAVFRYVSGYLSALFIFASYTFSSRLLKSKNAAFIGTFLFLLSDRWFDFRQITWPNFMSFIIYFTCLYFVIMYNDTKNKRFLLGISALSFTLLVVHLGFYELLAASLAMYFIGTLIFDRSYRGLDGVKEFAIIFFVAFILWLPVILLRISAISVTGFYDSNEIANKYGHVVQTAGVKYYLSSKWFSAGFIGVPYLHLVFPLVLLFSRKKRATAFLVANSYLIPAFSVVSLISLSLVFKFEYHIARLALISRFSLYFICGYLISSSFEYFYQFLSSKDRSLRRLAFSIIGIVISLLIFVQLFAIWVNGNPLIKRKYSFRLYVSKNSTLLKTWKGELERLIALGGGNQVIASDPVSSYYIYPLTGLRVISVPVEHAPNQLRAEDLSERIYDSYSILDHKTNEDKTLDLINKYNISYIFIDKSIDEKYALKSYEKFKSMNKLFSEIYNGKKAVIFAAKKKSKKRDFHLTKSNNLNFIYQAESFKGVASPKNPRAKGWRASYSPYFYAVHGAITYEEKSKMYLQLRSNIISRDIYILVYDYGGSKRNEIAITIGRERKTISWQNKNSGINRLHVRFDNYQNFEKLEIESIKRGQRSIFIDQIEVVRNLKSKSSIKSL